MSSDAGWMQPGSNGSVPMRPPSMAARMSRSDRTTTAKYAVRTTREREDHATKLGPRAHDVIRTVEPCGRPAPRDLDRARPGGDGHADGGRRVSDHDALLRGRADPFHRRECQVWRRLGMAYGIATEVGLDLTGHPQPPQDALAIRRAVADLKSVV